MNATLKEVLRWIIVLVFGGVGLWILLHDGFSILRPHSDDTLLGLLGFLGIAILSGIPFVVAYMAFWREYRQLMVVGAAVAAFVLLRVLMALPDLLGLSALMDRLHLRSGSPPVEVIDQGYQFLTFVASAWMALLFFRYARRAIERMFAGSVTPAQNA